jgi:hypothetical protein
VAARSTRIGAAAAARDNAILGPPHCKPSSITTKDTKVKVMSEHEAELRRRIADDDAALARGGGNDLLVTHDTLAWFLEAIGAQASARGTGPKPNLSLFEQNFLSAAFQLSCYSSSASGSAGGDDDDGGPPISLSSIPSSSISPPPRIQVAGIAVPALHADRVVAEMLRWIVAERQQRMMALKNILVTTPDANPQDQQRLVEKFKRLDQLLRHDAVFIGQGSMIPRDFRRIFESSNERSSRSSIQSNARSSTSPARIPAHTPARIPAHIPAQCWLTGSYVMATAEQREPYESRGSLQQVNYILYLPIYITQKCRLLVCNRHLTIFLVQGSKMVEYWCVIFADGLCALVTPPPKEGGRKPGRLAI